MNVNWLFIAVGMHYVQNKLIWENQNFLLNCGYFSLSARSSTFLTACWLSIYMSTSILRFRSHASVFRRKTESTNDTFQYYLQIFGSNSKLSHLDQQSENDWKFRFFKNKYVCLIMAGNDRLEKVTPSLELVRISNLAIKEMIEANS